MLSRVPAGSSRHTAVVCALFTLQWLMACGGSGNPSSTTPVSNIKQRVFVSNQTRELLHIVDASTDTLSTFTISASGTPTTLLESNDKSTTVAYDSADHGFDVIDNATESQKLTAALPDAATSVALAPNGQTGYAAIPTAICAVTPPTPPPPPGAVAVVNLTNGNVTNCVAVANAQAIALSHNGNTLLAFSRNSNTAYLINTQKLGQGAMAIADPGGQLDNPITAIFSSDDTTAYILSCGAECGGTAADVTQLSVASSALGTSVSVAAAREGLLSGSTLYVAGSNGGSGSLEVIDASSMTVQKTVAISDGVHDTMALGANGQLFVGARSCSNTAQGCLSIFNTGSGAVKFSPPNPSGDDITGIEPIPNRTVVYVCEGGEVIIYDTGTDAPQSRQFDIVGTAFDAREVF